MTSFPPVPRLLGILTLSAITAIATGACGRPAQDAPRTNETAPAAADAAPDEDATTVTIDPGMLRDLRVTTRPVESRIGDDRITVLGELAVNQTAYAEVAVPHPAQVTRVRVLPGDTVRAGAALAELTSPDLGRARADFVSAQARVALASAALDRKRALAAERIAPQREVQEAESDLAAAQAAVRGARATIAAFGEAAPAAGAADDALGSGFTLRAPVSGTVLERQAVIGQTLEPGVWAFRIANVSTLWLTVHAFERDAVRIMPGSEARLAFTALPGEDFTGTVRAVARQVDRESGTVDVSIDVRNREDRLRPGMTATASLPTGMSGARILTVPVGAVQRVRNAWCVFLPRPDGAFEIRRIGRGRDLDGEVEVLSGLAAGESIVVDGAFLLKAEAEKASAGHDEH